MDPLHCTARRPTPAARQRPVEEPLDLERRQIEREIDELLVKIFAQRMAEPENFGGREQLYAAHHALRARLKVLERS